MDLKYLETPGNSSVQYAPTPFPKTNMCQLHTTSWESENLPAHSKTQNEPSSKAQAYTFILHFNYSLEIIMFYMFLLVINGSPDCY